MPTTSYSVQTKIGLTYSNATQPATQPQTTLSDELNFGNFAYNNTYCFGNSFANVDMFNNPQTFSGLQNFNYYNGTEYPYYTFPNYSGQPQSGFITQQTQQNNITGYTNSFNNWQNWQTPNNYWQTPNNYNSQYRLPNLNNNFFGVGAVTHTATNQSFTATNSLGLIPNTAQQCGLNNFTNCFNKYNLTPTTFIQSTNTSTQTTPENNSEFAYKIYNFSETETQYYLENCLESYLPKKTSLSDEDRDTVTIENNQHIIKQSLKKNNYYENLKDYQRELIRIIGRQYFPKTLNPEMCDLIDKQFSKYSCKILGYVDNDIDYIPVYIPEYFCIQKLEEDNLINDISDRITTFKGLKVKYLTTRQLRKDQRKLNNLNYEIKDISQFIIASVEKIEIGEKPEIIVCIPDKFIDCNMKMADIFAKKCVRFIYYKQILDYYQFLFGMYKIICSTRINRMYGGVGMCDSTKTPELKVKYKVPLSELNVIEELHDIKGRVFKTLKRIESMHKKKRYTSQDKLLSLKKRINQASSELELETLSKKRKIDRLELETNLLLSNLKSSSLAKKLKYSVPVEFKEIRERINKKYLKELSEGTFSDRKIFESEFLDETAYSEISNPELTRIIREKINDINKIGLNKNNDLVERKFAAILLPLKFYEYNNTADYNKRISLSEAEVKIMHYLYFYSTKGSVPKENSQIVVSFTKDLPVENALTDNKIIVLLPQQFDENSKPLFDPNEFCLKVYFYNKVKNHYNDCNYPMYSFVTDLKYNLAYRYPDKRAEYTNIVKNIDIDEITLMDYFAKSYEIFIERIKERSALIQNVKKRPNSKNKAEEKFDTDEESGTEQQKQVNSE